MLFPVKIKRYLIYKNVDFAFFISIRKIILSTNNAINYTNLCRTCVNIHRVSSEKSLMMKAKHSMFTNFFTKILFSKLLKI